MFNQVTTSATLAQSPLNSIESAGRDTLRPAANAFLRPVRESSPFDTMYWNEAQFRRTSSPIHALAGNPDPSAAPSPPLPSGCVGRPPGAVQSSSGATTSAWTPPFKCERPRAVGWRTFGAVMLG